MNNTNNSIFHHFWNFSQVSQFLQHTTGATQNRKTKQKTKGLSFQVGFILYGASQWNLLGLTSEEPTGAKPTWYKRRPTMLLERNWGWSRAQTTLKGVWGVWRACFMREMFNIISKMTKTRTVLTFQDATFNVHDLCCWRNLFYKLPGALNLSNTSQR